MTKTHLRKKQVVLYKYTKHGANQKVTTDYFCSSAKNLTISTENPSQVTCEKCLDKYYQEYPKND